MVQTPFDWYAVVEGNEIEQGDILLDFEVPEVREPVEADSPIVDFVSYDMVVMTQSCDIPKASIEHLVLCPIVQISDAASLNPEFGQPRGKENLRRGNVFAYHLLKECGLPAFERDLMVVQFERVIERRKSSVELFVAAQDRRLRLLPPYREHLAQAFARFFMRVGLPIDIPPFT
tara:strand:- start:292 stop:816 length:525 start_codon:yes stop_codon:yes gene_type:complete